MSEVGKILITVGLAIALLGALIWLGGKANLPLGKAALAVVEALGGTVTESLAASIHYRLALGAQMIALIVGFFIFLRVPNRRRYQPASPQD